MKRKLISLMLIAFTLFFSGCNWSKKKDKAISANLETINIEENFNNSNEGRGDIFSSESNSEIRTISIDDNLFIEEGLDKKESIFEDDYNSKNDSKITTEEKNIDIIDNVNNDSMFFKDDSLNKTEENNDIVKMYKVGTIYFDFDVFNIIKKGQKEEFKKIINKLKDDLNLNNNLNIVIKGHSCDFAGSEEYNLQLSDKRANTVKKMINSNDIGNVEIKAYGCGTSEKIASGNKEEQNVNRRADIYLIN